MASIRKKLYILFFNSEYNCPYYDTSIVYILKINLFSKNVFQNENLTTAQMVV